MGVDGVPVLSGRMGVSCCGGSRQSGGEVARPWCELKWWRLLGLLFDGAEFLASPLKPAKRAREKGACSAQKLKTAGAGEGGTYRGGEYPLLENVAPRNASLFMGQ